MKTNFFLEFLGKNCLCFTHFTCKLQKKKQKQKTKTEKQKKKNNKKTNKKKKTKQKQKTKNKKKDKNRMFYCVWLCIFAHNAFSVFDQIKYKCRYQNDEWKLRPVPYSVCIYNQNYNTYY